MFREKILRRLPSEKVSSEEKGLDNVSSETLKFRKVCSEEFAQKYTSEKFSVLWRSNDGMKSREWVLRKQNFWGH